MDWGGLPYRISRKGHEWASLERVGSLERFKCSSRETRSPLVQKKNNHNTSKLLLNSVKREAGSLAMGFRPV